MLLLILVGATTWAWWAGATVDCGCFDAWLNHTPGEAVRVTMISPAAIVLAWVGSRHTQAPQPLFSIARIKENIFWRLLDKGEIPLIMLVNDRCVKKVWDKTVPTAEIIRAEDPKISNVGRSRIKKLAYG